MRIYYTAANNGDGSSSVKFYESQECIDRLEEDDPEGYGGGEGGGSFNVEGATDLKITTLDEVKQEIEDFHAYD